MRKEIRSSRRRSSDRVPELRGLMGREEQADVLSGEPHVFHTYARLRAVCL